jgi:glycosyltransferase involved in cell wall biosynthesis
MKRAYRLAVVQSHPIQYSVPLYRRLAKEPEIDLMVYYCSRQSVDGYFDPGFSQRVVWDVPLLDGYPSKFIPNLRRRDSVQGIASLINLGVVGEIRRGQYDAVWLYGYAYLTYLLAFAAACLSRTPIFYRSESSLNYDLHVRRPWHVRLFKPLWLRFLFKRVARFLAIGTWNKNFYRHYGARPDQIFHVPYAVDNEHFAVKTTEFRQQRQQLRADLSIGPDDVVFMFLGKMYGIKRPLELLQAYQQLSDVPGKALLMVGDGELRPQLEDYVRQHSLTGVHFVGFANQSEIPKYCAMSDVLVRPDGLAIGDWGLTVNEAMAASLAVIATDAIGATADLVKHGENGFVVRFGQDNVVMDDLVAAMRQSALDPAACRRMGQRSWEMISHWSYEQCVEGILAALHSLGS